MVSEKENIRREETKNRKNQKSLRQKIKGVDQGQGGFAEARQGQG